MSSGSEPSKPNVILTPDRRLRVFISSTLKELAEERAAVRESVLKLRLLPVMFEAGARPDLLGSTLTMEVHLAMVAQVRAAVDAESWEHGYGEGARMPFEQALELATTELKQAAGGNLVQ
ncbi:MAG TPA: DUF4062 domain-containing protein [Anaerolineales bacterium]